MLLLLGGYTLDMGPDAPGRARGISAYDFYETEGRIEYKGYEPAVNPSFLVVDATRKVVYAVRECTEEDGAGITSHSVRRTKDQKIKFQLLSDINLRGDHPCHLAIVDRTIIISSYTSGTVEVFALLEDGSIGEAIQCYHLPGSRKAKAHCAAYHGANDKVYICDLGADLLRVFDRLPDGTIKHLKEQDLAFPSGAGPRHLVAVPGKEQLIVNCELKGVLHLVDVSGPKPEVCDDALYLPERVMDEASGAALRLGPEGLNVYVSERNFSLVTVLRLDPKAKKISFRDSYPSGGERPRDIALSPGGKWLLAANLKDHRLAVFRTHPSGTLVLAQVYTKIPSATSIAWLNI